MRNEPPDEPPWSNIVPYARKTFNLICLIKLPLVCSLYQNSELKNSNLSIFLRFFAEKLSQQLLWKMANRDSVIYGANDGGGDPRQSVQKQPEIYQNFNLEMVKLTVWSSKCLFTITVSVRYIQYLRKCYGKYIFVESKCKGLKNLAPAQTNYETA